MLNISTEEERYTVNVFFLLHSPTPPLPLARAHTHTFIFPLMSSFSSAGFMARHLYLVSPVDFSQRKELISYI